MTTIVNVDDVPIPPDLPLDGGLMQVQCSEDDCCGNGGSGEPGCDCLATSSGCGIRVRCFFPRNWHNLPSREPHLIRIVQIDEDGEILSVVITTDDFDYIWNPPPGTTGTYRAEVCCFDPGPYAECKWQVLGTMTLNITADSCPLHVAVFACIQSVGTCGSSFMEEVRIYAQARSNCEITSLAIDGVDVLPDSDGPIHWVDVTGSCANYAGFNSCGPSETAPGQWTHPTGFDNVKVNVFVSEMSPIKRTEWCVVATDSCGNIRECCVEVPCWITKNYLRVEVPTISPNTTSSKFERIIGPSDLSNFLNSTDCVNTLKVFDDAFTVQCGSVPAFVSQVFVESIEVAETISGVTGGSYFFKRTPGTQDGLCSDTVVLGTGSYIFNFNMLGKRAKVDYVSFPNKLYVDDDAYFELSLTFPLTYTLHPDGGGFKIRASFGDPTILWDSNCRWLRKSGGLYVSNDCSEIAFYNGTRADLVAAGYIICGSQPCIAPAFNQDIATHTPSSRAACESLLGLNWSSPRFSHPTSPKSIFTDCGFDDFLRTVSGTFVVRPTNAFLLNLTLQLGEASVTPQALGLTYSEWVAI
jgi:hypothetical protein